MTDEERREVGGEAIDRLAEVWDYYAPPFAAWLRQAARLTRDGIDPFRANFGEEALRIVEQSTS